MVASWLRRGGEGSLSENQPSGVPEGFEWSSNPDRRQVGGEEPPRKETTDPGRHIQFSGSSPDVMSQQEKAQLEKRLGDARFTLLAIKDKTPTINGYISNIDAMLAGHTAIDRGTVKFLDEEAKNLEKVYSDLAAA